MPNCGHSYCEICLESAIKMKEKFIENQIDLKTRKSPFSKYFLISLSHKTIEREDILDPIVCFLSDNCQLQCPEDE